jgi:hypothetical protein
VLDLDPTTTDITREARPERNRIVAKQCFNLIYIYIYMWGYAHIFGVQQCLKIRLSTMKETYEKQKYIESHFYIFG